MTYFPAFLKLDNKKILIVGGGHIASEKLEKMLDFTDHIVVIAREISNMTQQYIEEKGLDYQKKKYQKGDIDGFDIVIVAVDDLFLQKKIYDEAKEKGVLCNAVDSVEYCDFIFPSYIKQGDLTIAVSTSGASPAIAKNLRRFLESILPSNISEFLQEMKELRSRLPKGKERMRLLDTKAKEYFESIKNKG